MMTKSYNTEYFKGLIREELLKKRVQSLIRNRLHDNYADLILNQFYKNGKILLESGFKAYLLEPLFNLEDYLAGKQCKNFDILVHNPLTKQTIFIEVKSSFNSIGKLLSDFKESINIARNKFDDVISPILNLKYSEHNSVEYVLVLPRTQSLEVIERISSDDMKDIIIWTVSEITKHILKHDISNVSELISNNRTHKNSKLRSILYNDVPLGTIKTMNCLLNSDPCQKLEFYVPLIHRCKFDEFKFNDIKHRIFDLDINFKRYSNPDDAKKFVFAQIIQNLKGMDMLKVDRERGDIFQNNYSLKIDRRLVGYKVVRQIQKRYMDTYLKKKEDEIEKEALERSKVYHNQKNLDEFNSN